MITERMQALAGINLSEKWAGVAKNNKNQDVEYFENPTPREVKEDLFDGGNDIVPALIDKKSGKVYTWKEASGYILHHQMAKHMGKLLKNFLPIYAYKNGNVELTGDKMEFWLKANTDYEGPWDYDRFVEDIERLVINNGNLKTLVGSSPKFINYDRVKKALDRI